MDSKARAAKPHAVCIPCPGQGHINSMLKFSKLLHYKGFHISFIHTENSYNQIIDSSGPNSLNGLQDFRFEAISDGLSASESQAKGEDRSKITQAIRSSLSDPFRRLVKKLNESNGPKVTCIVSDIFMSFTLGVAAEFGVPILSFCSVGACGFMGSFAVNKLIEKGIVPLKSEDDLTNGYLDILIDCIPGLTNMRLRDFPSFIRTTDPNHALLNFVKDETEESLKATAIVIHTFDDLEGPTIDAMSTVFPPIYAIGPLDIMCSQILTDDSLNSIDSNLWKNDNTCLRWLEGKAPKSVVYVNFGSIAVITKNQLIEFAWGLVNSGYEFLWVIRPDLVTRDSNILPEELLLEVRKRGLIISWCPQLQVLMHLSIGVFLTHCGWNSMMESISCGIPLICWPYFADQQTNCRYACIEWRIGLEISNAVKREEVDKTIKEVLEGEKGIEMRWRALKLKESACKATELGGKAFKNLERAIEDVLLQI